MVFWHSCLSRNIANWDRIGVPDEQRQWITDGVPIIFNVHPDPFYFKNPTFNNNELQFLRSEVSELLRDGAIIAMDNKPEYVSAIKCVAKKEPGKLRLVIDLSHLNKHVNTPKFQYDSFAKVADTIQTGDQFTVLV